MDVGDEEDHISSGVRRLNVFKACEGTRVMLPGQVDILGRSS